MSKEYLWGCELSSSNPLYVWDMGDDSDDEDGHSLCYNLLLRQAVLGTKAMDGEVNVVALETVGALASAIEQPLFRLKAGHVDQCQLDILITHPGSRLRLVEGSGPLFIWGQHLIDLATDEDFSEENDSNQSETVMDDADIQEELEFLKGDIEKHADEPLEKSRKRRKASKQSRAQKDKDTDEDDDEEEEENSVEKLVEDKKSATVSKSKSSRSSGHAKKANPVDV